MKKLIFVLLGCALVFGGIFGFITFKNHMIAQYFATMKRPPVPVTAARASEQGWSRTVTAIGVLEAIHGVDISPEVSGGVEQILFDSGQQVTKGDPLVKLDSDVEQAELRSAQAQLDLADSESRRAQALAPNKTISVSALDKAESEAKVALAAVGRLNALIAKKTINAPFSGILGIRRVNLGQYVDAGTAMVNIQDLSSMLVNFGVSQKDLPNLKVGQEIRMSVDTYPGRNFSGKITTIAPLISDKTGMIAVQGTFENTDRTLRPGMYARLDVILPDLQHVVIVPQPAISYSLYGNAVYLVKRTKDDKGQDQTTVDRVIVETGTRRNGWIIVSKGLKAGDEIVTSGQLKLDNGAHVEVTQDQALTPPNTLPLE
ncbi:MAG TPA: efflux RND transporter periplasmic adaptor subunit [Dongiaceae bacterium]|nr:efflux RND transporter periplasmic adaptor subunit [Dongiaceae bacterium]